MIHAKLLVTALLLCTSLCMPMGAQAAEAAGPGASDDQASRSETDLAQTLADIDALRANIDALHLRIPKVEGIDRKIYERRLEREWAELIDRAHNLARDLDLLQGDGVDPSGYRDAVASILPSVDHALADGADRLRARLSELSYTDAAQDPKELAELYFRRHELLERLIALLRARSENLQLLTYYSTEQQSLDDARAALTESINETAERVSLALEIARDEAAATGYQLSELPGDEHLKAMRSILLARVNQLADVLHGMIPLLEAQNLDATRYRQQIVLSTGQISEDLLDGHMLADLSSQAVDEIAHWVSENAARLIVKTLVLVLILTAFWFLARLVANLIERAMASDRVNASQLLRNLSARFARQMLLLLGLLVALSQIGVAVGPVLAGLGVAGFVIGFALQDTLSNFASGIMILFYRPFDVGDIVEAGDVFGTVKGMSLVNSTFLTFDNQELVVPNSKIWGGVIRNVTAQTTRRVDMKFGISYADEIEHAERVLTDIVQSHPKILDEPAPVVRLHELGDSSVNFVVRPWVLRDDYWDVYWDVTRAVKKRFDAEGISIPFPQRDVHLYTARDSAQPDAAPS